MIAICPPAESPWNGVPTTPERTGSLRRIDEIVNELMGGYALAAAADARGGRAGLPDTVVDMASRGNLPLQPHDAPVEMLLLGERC